MVSRPHSRLGTRVEKKKQMNNLHYTIDGETPLCGWHKANFGTYALTEEITFDTCDLCIYVLWRKRSNFDILEHLPKCRVGTLLWPGEESVYTSCDVPKLLHENIPEDRQIHWDFHIGFWVGSEAKIMVFV